MKEMALEKQSFMENIKEEVFLLSLRKSALEVKCAAAYKPVMHTRARDTDGFLESQLVFSHLLYLLLP